jgi:hypothetical protein
MNFGFCAGLPILVSKYNKKYTQSDTIERKRIAGEIKVRSFIDGYKIILSMIKIFIKKE